MYLEREMREKLSSLSKQVLGAPSAYMRMLDKGTYVPKFHPETKQLMYKEKVYHTPESLLELLRETAKRIEDSYIKKI